MAFSMESTILNFIEVDEMTYTFTQNYGPIAPMVVASSDQNVEIFVDEITTGSVKISASQKGTFSVYVHVIGRHRGS